MDIVYSVKVTSFDPSQHTNDMFFVARPTVQEDGGDIIFKVYFHLKKYLHSFWQTLHARFRKGKQAFLLGRSVSICQLSSFLVDFEPR